MTKRRVEKRRHARVWALIARCKRRERGRHDVHLIRAYARSMLAVLRAVVEGVGRREPWTMPSTIPTRTIGREERVS